MIFKKPSSSPLVYLAHRRQRWQRRNDNTSNAERRLETAIVTTLIIVASASATTVPGRSYDDRPLPRTSSLPLSYVRHAAVAIRLHEERGGDADDSTNTVVSRQPFHQLTMSNLHDEAHDNGIIHVELQEGARNLRGGVEDTNHDTSRQAVTFLAIIFAALMAVSALIAVVTELVRRIPCLQQRLEVDAEESHHGRRTQYLNTAQVVPVTAPPMTIHADPVKNQDQPPPSAVDGKGPTCWICLENGADEGGEPLQRDCSCRGDDSGFAHLSCIVGYAESQSKKWHSRHSEDMSEFTKPWEKCVNCHQSYQNKLAVDISDRFVSFVTKNQHPNDTQLRVEALELKVRALLSVPPSELHPTQRLEAKIIALNLLSLVQQMNAESPMGATMRCRQLEPLAYNHLGVIALAEGTGLSTKNAVTHFEKFHQLSKAISDFEGIAIAEINIACAKSKNEECNVRNNDVRLMRSRNLYKLRASKYGEDNAATINDGMNLAIASWTAHRTIEAEKLLRRVVTVSERVHGPHHKTTKHAESWLRHVKERYVWVEHEGESKSFQALCYEEGGQTCVIQGPIAEPRIVGDETSSIATIKGIRFAPGTPVVCCGFRLQQTIHLNGKIGDLRSDSCKKSGIYKVYFEDDYLQETCFVEWNNLRILFEVHGESQE